MRISYGVSIVYHDYYLYAESILALDCDSYPYKSLINIPKRQRRLSKHKALLQVGPKWLVEVIKDFVFCLFENLQNGIFHV